MPAGQTPSCYNGAPNAYNYNGGFVLTGPNVWNFTSNLVDRDAIANIHYYIPHKDGSRDDLQAIYVNNYLNTSVYSSTNDQGGVAYQNAVNGSAPLYIDGYAYNQPTGGLLPANYQSYTSIYSFPNVPAHGFFGQIDPNERDGYLNNQAIFKAQYTKSLGTNALARVYAYTYYSNWMNTGPQCTWYSYNCGIPSDYELSSHTRGVSLQVTDQLNAQNLLQINGDWTTSTTLRDNNTQMINGVYGPNSVNARTVVGALVDSTNPTSGVCYDATGTPQACFASGSGLNPAAQWATIGQAYNGTITAPPTGVTCGAGPCQYLTVGNGQYATFNTVQPIFWGAAITDEFRPNSKLTINGGVRVDIYQYQGADTSGTAARQFWYNAYNQDECLQPGNNNAIVSKVSLGISPSTACTTVSGYANANFQNPAGQITQTYQVWEPRLGATYALSPNTVLRASYGRYGQPPNSAFEQYNALQADAPALLYGTYGFQKFGFVTPNHPIPPAASNNYDFSLEQQFPHQIALKVTPFLRSTQNQIAQFYLNQATNFVSGLNVGNQTSEGVELEVDKGDFAQQGISGKLSFTYTNSYIRYNTLSNGSTVLDPINNAISAYNAYTKAGGGAPCYTPATSSGNGTPDPTCAAGDVANPYYNARPQATLATNGNYIPYDTLPVGLGVAANAYGYPYVASLILNDRIKNFSIAPILQMFAGQRRFAAFDERYRPCNLQRYARKFDLGDPRYGYGAVGGAPYDASTCGTLPGGIPDPYTGQFDSIGQFSQPTQLILSFQATYDVNKNFQLTANIANAVNTCFGGSKVGFQVAGTCAYGLGAGGNTAGVIGNTYNPGTALQPYQQLPYLPTFASTPFGIYVNGTFKL